MSARGSNGQTARTDDVAALAPAAERTLRIFEAFQRGLEPLTLSKLAREIDAPISSCHNLVRTLTSRGYLYSLESQRSFYPTRKLWDLATAIAAHDPVIERIMPIVQELRDSTLETVILGKRQDNGVLYLLVLEGPQTIRYVANAGRAIKLHTSAIGKALLSTLGDADLEAWLNSRKLTQVTAHSNIDPNKLGAEIRHGRARGYQLTVGENVADVGAIGMPIRIGGETMGIAVAGPTDRILANRDEVVAQLREAAHKLASGPG